RGHPDRVRHHVGPEPPRARADREEREQRAEDPAPATTAASMLPLDRHGRGALRLIAGGDGDDVLDELTDRGGGRKYGDLALEIATRFRRGLGAKLAFLL